MYYKLISCLPINIFDQLYKEQIIHAGCKISLWSPAVGSKGQSNPRSYTQHRMVCSQAVSYCLTARFSQRVNSRSGGLEQAGLNWSNNESGF